MADLAERVFHVLPPPQLPSCPHCTGALQVPSSGVCCWAVRAGMWVAIPQELPGSRQATGGGVQKCATPLAEPGVGQGARGVGFGPGSILVSRWAAEGRWRHHM